MRVTTIGLVALSLTALTIVVGACAEAPTTDDLSGLAHDKQNAEPPENVKLPPSSNPASDSTDGGSTPPKKDPPKKEDASTPPEAADSGPGEDCDPNDASYYLKFIMAGTPTACPCAAGQCCYLALGCVAK